MPRVTKSVTAKAKHKKVLSATKGHYGARSRLFKTAKQSNIKSLQYAFRDRKNRKRAFRSLWISRINAGSRSFGVSYSILMNGLIKNNIFTKKKLKLKRYLSKKKIKFTYEGVRIDFTQPAQKRYYRPDFPIYNSFIVETKRLRSTAVGPGME